MRVLHLTWEYPPVVYGGLGQVLGDLAPAQAAAGHQVGVLALGHDVTGAGRLDGAPRREVRDGVRVERVELPAAPRGRWEGTHLLDVAAALVAPVVDAVRAMPTTVDPVVVHSHDWMTAAAGAAAATALGAAWVHSVHATEFGRRSGRLDGDLPRAVHRAERGAVQAFSTHRRPDAVLVCSEAMRTEVVGVLGADPARVHVVPAAVDAARWVAPAADADRARALWSPSDGPLLVAAGRLEWEKGSSTVLRALPAVARRHPGVRLVVAGDGSYRSRLEALAEEVGVGGRVVWTGWLEHAPLRALLSVAGAVLATPRYEPFGLVARQAQAAGAPVVVTEVGGLADAVTPGVTGLRVPAGDVDALGAQVGALLADPRRAAALGEAGRAAVRAWTPPARPTSGVAHPTHTVGRRRCGWGERSDRPQAAPGRVRRPQAVRSRPRHAPGAAA